MGRHNKASSPDSNIALPIRKAEFVMMLNLGGVPE
jgi:hypothetical protein